MLHPRRAWFILAVGAMILSAVGNADAQDGDPQSHWIDFNHYVRIARPDLAQAAGSQLLDSVDDGTLLDLVEGGEYQDYEVTIARARKIETLVEIADQLAARIQQARIDRARDPKRIMSDIEMLAEGGRANANAIARLRAAGQYAAPALLQVLLDDTQSRLHPYVIAAMVAVGRPLVYPLSVAMIDLEAVPQGQVAQVLAEIGYPRALPYLKMVVEDEGTDPATRSIATAAFEHLANFASVPLNASAAELFETLGRNHYDASTRGDIIPGFSPSDDTGVVWEYVRGSGLIPINVPSVIFGDVLAMHCAQRALRINETWDPALSLWLMSNVRRENNLPEGEMDLSYGPTLLEPMFYLRMAGPLRQHDVLEQALNDRDAILALDAIDALSSTAGTDALVNREGTVQPLLRALSYPDRRVRFAAAFALTNTRPAETFPGSDAIVPVLAEAVRQTATRYAVVIGQDQEAINLKAAMLRELDYEPITGRNLTDIAVKIMGKPGIDLIVTDVRAERAVEIVQGRVTNYKLASVPLLALCSPSDMAQVNAMFDGRVGLYAVADTDSASALRPAIDMALREYAGEQIDEDQAHDFAATALALLRDVAIASGDVFNIYDAEPALLQAINDQREDIVVLAANVLAVFNTPEGQSTVADAALDPARSIEVRIELLNALALSATHIGNKLGDMQLANLLKLVKDSKGDLAIAAARAHGALTLPTANVVELIAEAD